MFVCKAGGDGLKERNPPSLLGLPGAWASGGGVCGAQGLKWTVLYTFGGQYVFLEEFAQTEGRRDADLLIKTAPACED